MNIEQLQSSTTAHHFATAAPKVANLDDNETIKQAVSSVLDGKTDYQYLEFDVAFDNKPKPGCNMHLAIQNQLINTPLVLKISKLETLTNTGEVIKGCSLSFFDPKSSPSHPFGHQFAAQEIFQLKDRNISILQKIVSPHFGGKKALAWVKEINKVIETSHLYFIDSSVLSTLKCCKEASLVSLRLLEIFKYGKTWYELQGADFPRFYDDIDYESFQFMNKYLGNFFDLKFYNQDYIETNYQILLNETQQDFAKALDKSKNYLYSLTIEDLLETFESQKHQPPTCEIYQSTLQAAKLTQMPHHCRIGELVTALTEKEAMSDDPEIHKLKHLFFDSVINFNYKHLLVHYLNTLMAPPTSDEFFLIILLSSVFTKQFLEFFFDLTKSSQETPADSEQFLTTFIVNCCTKDMAQLTDYLNETIANKTPELSQKFIDEWKSQENDFMNAKYFLNNYDENLKNIIAQFFVGPQDFDLTFFMLLLLHYVRGVKVSQIEKWAPNFSTSINKLVGQKVFKPGSTEPLVKFLEPLKDNPEVFNKTVQFLSGYLMESGKFYPLQFYLELDPQEKSPHNFFLSKIFSFFANPFEFNKKSLQ